MITVVAVRPHSVARDGEARGCRRGEERADGARGRRARRDGRVGGRVRCLNLNGLRNSCTTKFTSVSYPTGSPLAPGWSKMTSSTTRSSPDCIVLLRRGPKHSFGHHDCVHNPQYGYSPAKKVLHGPIFKSKSLTVRIRPIHNASRVGSGGHGGTRRWRSTAAGSPWCTPSSPPRSYYGQCSAALFDHDLSLPNCGKTYSCNITQRFFL